MLVAHLKWEEEFRKLDAAIKAAAEEEIQEGEEEEAKLKQQEDKKKLEDLKNRIKQSIRNIVRYCYASRPEFDKLKELIGHKKSSKMQEFLSLFFQQFDIFKIKMTTSKEEEDSKKEEIAALDEKIRNISLIFQ
jgi:hypothetical protein